MDLRGPDNPNNPEAKGEQQSMSNEYTHFQYHKSSQMIEYIELPNWHGINEKKLDGAWYEEEEQPHYFQLLKSQFLLGASMWLRVLIWSHFLSLHLPQTSSSTLQIAQDHDQRISYEHSTWGSELLGSSGTPHFSLMQGRWSVRSRYGFVWLSFRYDHCSTKTMISLQPAEGPEKVSSMILVTSYLQGNN